MIKPKLKLLILLVASTVTLFVNELFLSTLLLILVIGISFFIKTRRKLSERIIPLLGIGLIVILFQTIFNTSLTLINRFLTGLINTEKIISLSMLVFIFTATTSVSQIVSIFSFLPAQFQLMLTITFSLIPVILDESQKIILIQSSRGHNFRSLNMVRSFLPIMIPLLHRSLKRAEQLSIVLSSLGYDTG